jgi:group II intron reverse transcriptase/maturase
MSTAAESLGQAMYMASKDDRLWLLNVQRKLYARSWEQTNYVFEKLWGLITDLRNLRVALDRVRRNHGARTAGVDRVTVGQVLVRGSEQFLADVRSELREGKFCPEPVRRVLIPKPGKPGKFRPLGIPTVKDRVIQAAMKNILEPIFEADFYPVSYGFRPGRSVHGAIAQLKTLLLPRGMKRWGTAEKPPFQWAIEGDIKGCFDNISHHGLMERVRRRISDAKLNRLVVAFLKAGVMSDKQWIRTDRGTPQGGILSPLLSNIALGAIEERYERHVWPRGTATRARRAPKGVQPSDPKAIARRANSNRAYDRQHDRPVFVPIRYADDFIILVAHRNGNIEGCHATAEQEKAALAKELESKLGLTLSEEKTLVTPVTSTMRFLGHHLRVRRHPYHGRLVPHAVIPKERSQRLRHTIKGVFSRATLNSTLENRLGVVNPILRGWANFYKHAWGAKRVFVAIDHYVWWTIHRWLHKKHHSSLNWQIYAQYTWRKPRGRMRRWRDGTTKLVSISSTRVGRFLFGWQKPPLFASTPMESPVRNERRTPGSARGVRKPRGKTHG